MYLYDSFLNFTLYKGRGRRREQVSDETFTHIHTLPKTDGDDYKLQTGL